MRKDMVLGVTVIAQRQFFSWRRGSKSQVDILLVFLIFFRMAACTIHIEGTFSKMEVRIGLRMAVHTNEIAFMVDVLVPLCRVNEERTDFSITHNLGNIRLSVAFEAVLIIIHVKSGIRLLGKKEDRYEQDDSESDQTHAE